MDTVRRAHIMTTVLQRKRDTKGREFHQAAREEEEAEEAVPGPRTQWEGKGNVIQGVAMQAPNGVLQSSAIR